ncbi:hypothetical protein M6B38_309190 [Iris pallida]|uniref:Uncharacterized protein n=1 Tax=Iris pallida TaxID=29817 RepID=A0AAX6HJ26_IRIPA|nr:hypothetical protein M6B38_309190 [Iris pallida]
MIITLTEHVGPTPERHNGARPVYCRATQGLGQHMPLCTLDTHCERCKKYLGHTRNRWLAPCRRVRILS